VLRTHWILRSFKLLTVMVELDYLLVLGAYKTHPDQAGGIGTLALI
jgi:hypothetical protein